MHDKPLKDKLLELKNQVVTFFSGTLIGFTFYFKEINFFYYLLLILIAFFLIVSKKRKVLVFFCSLLFGYFYPLVFYKLLVPDLNLLLNKESNFIGEIISDYEINSLYNKKFYLRLTNLLSNGLCKKDINAKILVISSSYERYSPGDLVQLTGVLKKPKTAILPGLFDERKYLFTKDVYYVLKLQQGSLVFLAEPKSTYFIRKAKEFRERFITSSSNYLSRENLSLVSGIVFGSKAARIQGELKGKIQSLGLSHIVSASGFNVSILVGGIYWLFKFMRGNNITCVIVSLIATIAYIFVADFSPSILRAGYFVALILIGDVLNKRLRIFPGISFILLLFFIVSPANLLDIGLQLSVLAFTGIWLFFSESQKIFFSNVNKFLIFVYSVFLQSLFAQIMTIPLIVFYFHNVQLLGIVSNLVAVPVAWVILLLGIISALISFLPFLDYLNVLLYYFLNLFSGFFLFWINVLDKFAFKELFLPGLNFCKLLVVYSFVALLLISFFISSFRRYIRQLIFVFLFLLLMLSVCDDKHKCLNIFFVPKYNQDLILILSSFKKPVVLATALDKNSDKFLKNYLRLNNIHPSYISYNLSSNTTFKDDLLSVTPYEVSLVYKGFSLKVIKKYQGKISGNVTILKLPKLQKNDPDFSSLFLSYPEYLIVNDYKRLSEKSKNDVLLFETWPSKTFFLSKEGTVAFAYDGLKCMVYHSEE